MSEKCSESGGPSGEKIKLVGVFGRAVCVCVCVLGAAEHTSKVFSASH